jgi:hypothetical protein
MPEKPGNPLAGCVILIMWAILAYLMAVTTVLLIK